MAIYVLPRKLRTIIGKEQSKKIYNRLSSEEIRLKTSGYDPHVEYSLNNEFEEGACFSDIFSLKAFKEGDVLKIDLFYDEQNRLKTRYTNIKKYFKHLSRLYKGIDIKCEVDSIGDNHNRLIAHIEVTKEYPNVVIRDICTRVRFLFEGDFNIHMDKCLSKKDFKLNDIEESIGKEHAYHVQIGHWLFTNNVSSNIINYDNYEENILKFAGGDLQKAIKHLIKK